MREVKPDDIALDWSPERAEMNRRAVHEALDKRRSRVAFATFFVPVSAALAVALLFLWQRDAAPDASGTSGTELASNATPAQDDRLTLLDGSWAQTMTSGSRASIALDEATRSQVRLESGELEVEVVPNAEREFEVVAGDIRVRVLGTRFFVEERGERVQVRVVHGRVRVSWPGGHTELTDGESNLFPPPAGAVPDSDESEAEAEIAEPAPEVEPPTPVREVTARTGRWRVEAAASDFSNAYQELRRDGFDTVRNTPEDLMLAADVARLSGHPAEATAPLRRLISRHASDARAPLAAFTLGRVLIEDLHRPAEAVAAFRRAQELAPRGPLFADALVRQAEAQAASGDVSAAKESATRYLQRFPQGRHAGRAQSIMER